MTIAQAFDEITVQHGGTASKSGSIASAIDALNDALAGSDQEAAQDIEGAVRLLGQHIGGGSASGTIEITENGEYDVSAYATADVEVSGGGLPEFVFLMVATYEDELLTLPNTASEIMTAMDSPNLKTLVVLEPPTDPHDAYYSVLGLTSVDTSEGYTFNFSGVSGTGELTGQTYYAETENDYPVED